MVLSRVLLWTRLDQPLARLRDARKLATRCRCGGIITSALAVSGVRLRQIAPVLSNLSIVAGLPPTVRAGCARAPADWPIARCRLRITPPVKMGRPPHGYRKPISQHGRPGRLCGLALRANGGLPQVLRSEGAGQG